MSKGKKMGRPTIYTDELATTICQRIANGETFRDLDKDPKMPSVDTMIRWLTDNKHKDFSEQYKHARAVQAEKMFDELLEIADDGSNDLMTVKKGNNEYEMENKEVTNRSRLRVDTRKWYLSKVLPKKYGEKLDVTSDGKALPAPIYGGGSKKD